MIKPFVFMVETVLSILRSRQELVLENLALRQQIMVLKRSVKRPYLTKSDRMFWVVLSKIWGRWSEVLQLVKPDTVVRWPRESFRHYWAWKSRVRRSGRPSIDPKVRALIRDMCRANPLWGAPRIHGELLKLDWTFTSPKRRCRSIWIVDESFISMQPNIQLLSGQHNKSLRHFHLIRRRNICSVTVMESTGLTFSDV